jgi:hypothetical protein
MVYDITFTSQQFLCFFMADIVFQFYLRLQYGAVMASSSRGLFEEEIEQPLLEELADSDPSNSSSEDDSSGTNDLAVGEVIALEFSDNEDDIRSSTAPSAPNSLSATFTWEDMTNYVEQREKFVGNCDPENVPK